VGDRIEAQLDDQARVFLAQSSKNYVNAAKKELHLSPIFDWYGGDFTAKTGYLDKFILPYLKETDQKTVGAGGFAVKFTNYDWSLNSQP